MDHAALVGVINAETERWERFKKSFDEDMELSAFLKDSYLVVMFDCIQLDILYARNLYTPTVFLNPDKPDRSGLEREKYRLEMVEYFNGQKLRELFIEVRFSYLKMEFIARLKSHPEIMHLNRQSNASINVVLNSITVNRAV